jgi:hypothetical protein
VLVGRVGGWEGERMYAAGRKAFDLLCELGGLEHDGLVG